MKTIFLLAGILFLSAANAQGGLLNKVKNKVKGQNEATEKTADNNTTGQTVSGYNGISQEEYIRALGKKHSGMGELKYLRGTNELAINQYYDHAKETDMANFYPVMQKKGRPSGDGANDYDEIMDMRKNYPALYEKDFKPLLNGTIDGAYQLKKTNISEAVKNLKLAIRFNDACLMVIPDMQSALEIKKEIEKAVNNIGGEQSKTFTGDFHKQNAGKILFSKEPIIPGKENPSQFITSFGAGDHIYAMVYLPGSVQELTGTSDEGRALGQYRIKLDGQELYVNTLDFTHNQEDKGKTWFPIEIRPDPSTAIHGLDATYFAERFNALSPRKHVVGLYLTMPNNYGEPFAYGEFKLDWTNGDGDKMTADAKLAVTKAQNNYAKTVQLNPVFSKPSHTFSDPALSPANLKKAFLAATPNAVQILKMVTIKEDNHNDDWNILSNDYGVITGKVTLHYTSFVYKAKDGNCYMHYISQFGKAATGGGSYGNLTMYPTGMIDERIACENIK